MHGLSCSPFLDRVRHDADKTDLRYKFLGVYHGNLRIDQQEAYCWTQGFTLKHQDQKGFKAQCAKKARI